MDQVITWFKDYEDFKESQRQYWVWKHEPKTCDEDGAGCECPPEPELRKKPVVEDFVETTKKSCNLLDVLAHPCCGDMEDPGPSILDNPESLRNLTPQNITGRTHTMSL